MNFVPGLYKKLQTAHLSLPLLCFYYSQETQPSAYKMSTLSLTSYTLYLSSMTCDGNRQCKPALG